MEIFNTFIMGGYECADHINRSGQRINLLAETQFDVRAVEDYEMLSAVGIKVVREGICWSVVESESGKYDFTEVLNPRKSSRKIRNPANLGPHPFWLPRRAFSDASFVLRKV